MEYQSLSPFAAYGSRYNIFDLSANPALAAPALPVLQPTLKAGTDPLRQPGPGRAVRWDHTHWYGALGLVLAHRFAKNFEVGAEAFGGFSEAVFPNLLPGQEARGATPTSSSRPAGGSRSIRPTTSASTSTPSLKYLLSLGALKDFDGLIFGIGFSASFRFGQDPDWPRPRSAALRFDRRCPCPPVFAAMQSYYAGHPGGADSRSPTPTDTRSPTSRSPSSSRATWTPPRLPPPSPELAGGESREVDLFALVQPGGVPHRGGHPPDRGGDRHLPVPGPGGGAAPVGLLRPARQDRRDLGRRPQGGRLHHPGRQRAAELRQLHPPAAKDREIPTYNEPLQVAMQVFSALAEMGCLYQADPALPFTRVRATRWWWTPSACRGTR